MVPFILVFFLYLTQCKAGDPCPNKDQLRLCTCTHRKSGHERLKREAIDEDSIVLKPSNHQDYEIRVTSNYETVELLESEDAPIEMRNSNTFDVQTTLQTIVECNASRSIIALEEAVTLALHRKMIDRLTVYNVPPSKENTLARLPNRWLRNTRVRQLEVLNSLLFGDFIWRGNPLEGQEHTLIVLTVNNCFLFGALTYETNGTVNTKSLDHLPYLEVIDFSKNHLVSITATAFQRPPANLSTILLSHNSIQSIEIGAFKMVQHLNSVDLSYNLLETITRGVFAAPARNLTRIDLSWNHLTVLPQDFFTNMPALKTVNLSMNFLYSLPDKPWGPVWTQLDSVDVEGNFINCDCNLLWLVKSDQSQKRTIQNTTNTRRNIKGRCSYYNMSGNVVIEHQLSTLTINKLMCIGK